MPTRKGKRAVLRSFSKTINAPERFVYDWCTDFSEDDPKLTGSTYERRILTRTKVKCVFVDLFPGLRGRQNVAANFVTLKPPNRWHLELYGDPHDASLDFRLSGLGRGKTKLNITSRDGLLDSEVAGFDQIWGEYASEIENDFKSSKFSVFPTGFPERVRLLPEGERKLAAIMFTDMIGYTALGQRNESLSLALAEEQKRIIRPALERHGGREVKTMGDSFLVEFPSALEAVRGAYEIQRATKEFNVPLSDNMRIHLRIGIHLGDVTASQGDIAGDAVNVASRIEPLAEEDGVCLTRQVYDQVRSKLELSFVSLGLKDLKNVAEPLEVYRLVMPWEGGRGEVQTLRQLDRTRIAVLPFTNLSPDPNDEYFADGLTEELIARLSLMKGLEVIARTSVMNYKKKEKNVTQIGKELKAGTLLEGSVRKAGNRIRVTAQLINTSTEGHLWAESYDRELDDIFAVQSSVAEKVADSLKLKLVGEEKNRIEAKGPKDPEAYFEYLRGVSHYGGGEAGIRKSIQHLERALELEPNYAAAMAILAQRYGSLGYLAFEPMDRMYAKCKELAIKALELDETIPEAHYAMGVVGFYIEGDWAKAEKEYRRALELNPSLEVAHSQYAMLLSSLGRTAEAISEIEKSMELDPLRVGARYIAGDIYQIAGKYSEALSHYAKAREIEPDSGHTSFGITLLLMGRIEEGVKEFERAAALSDTPFFKSNLGYAYGVSGRREEALGLIEEIKQASEKMPVSYNLAQVYAGLGEKEEALNWLEKAYEDRTLFVFPLFPFEPFFASLRQEPRFKELVKKVGLEKYQAPSG